MRRLVPLLLLAVPRLASADCIPPSGIAPVALEVPHHASVFVELDQAIDFRPGQDVPVFANWISGHGEAKVTQIAPAIARVDFDGDDEAGISINHHGYAVKATPHLELSPTLDSLERDRGRTKCTEWDDLTVHLRQAASIGAVRADWTFHGKVTTYWAVPEKPALDSNLSHVDVELGKISCGGTTIPPNEMAEGGHLALTAVMVDGSTRVLASAIEVSDRTLPVNTHEVAREEPVVNGRTSATLEPLAEVKARADASPSPERTGGTALLLIVLGLMTSALAAFVAQRFGRKP